MVVLATNADGYVVDDDYDRLDKKKLFELVSAQFWASYVTLEQCAMRFRNSWAFGLYSPGGEMVGCMRLVTGAFKNLLGTVLLHRGFPPNTFADLA